MYHFDREGLKEAIVKKLGTTFQRKAAKEIGINESSLCRLKHGGDMHIDTYLLICQWLNVKPDKFFKRYENHNTL